MTLQREVILSVDPGLDGALAVLIDGRLMEVEDMPTLTVVVGKKNRRRIDPYTLDGLLRTLLTSYCGPVDHIHVIVERVHSTPRDGTVGAFSFGEGYGLLQGIIIGMMLPLRHVPPETWKRGLKLRKGKDASRLRAMELFPEFRGQFARVRDDGRAEAALIGHWAHGQLKEKGIL